MSTMTVQVITPSGVVYDHHASYVLAQTTSGDIGILPNMISTIAALTIGELKVRRLDNDKNVDWIAVNGGIIEINNSVITVIADSSERERDIDISRAERAKKRAERDIELATADHKTSEAKRAQVALHRAINRISVAEHHSKK